MMMRTIRVIAVGVGSTAIMLFAVMWSLCPHMFDGSGYQPARVEGADYASFKIRTGDGWGIFASDKNRKYRGAILVKQWAFPNGRLAPP